VFIQTFIGRRQSFNELHVCTFPVFSALYFAEAVAFFLLYSHMSVVAYSLLARVKRQASKLNEA